uniref:Pre-mRNA splicing factor n=1 Tax=Quercus lobata TaxID=97700 RepID=A0A7N2LKE7_QUELO
MRNHKLSFVEDASIEPFIFDVQYYTLHKYGYAPDPSASAGNNYVCDLDALQKNDAISIYNIPQHEQKKRKIEKKETEKEEANGHEENLNKVELQNPASDTWKVLDCASQGCQGQQRSLLYTEEIGAHLEWPHEGRVCNKVLPKTGAFDIVSKDGYKGENLDTETGQVISTFSTGKIPYVVRLNPDDNKQNILLAGMSDKKIVQWDMNTGQVTQEYDQHLRAVNNITFVDNNRRFVTSSDDKSLRVWEFGILVVIKYIREPHMHSMPSISLHPSTNYLAALSLDDQILMYSTRDKFQLNKKKIFSGHIVAGYACQVNFSLNGRSVMSGDGEGKCWFWDWKTRKVFRTLKCHEGVCIGCEWHLLEQSKVATCGWDGLVKYW